MKGYGGFFFFLIQLYKLEKLGVKRSTQTSFQLQFVSFSFIFRCIHFIVFFGSFHPFIGSKNKVRKLFFISTWDKVKASFCFCGSKLIFHAIKSCLSNLSNYITHLHFLNRKKQIRFENNLFERNKFHLVFSCFCYIYFEIYFYHKFCSAVIKLQVSKHSKLSFILVHFLTNNWSKDIIINRFLDRFSAAKDKKYDDSFIWKIDSYFLSSFSHFWGHYRKIFCPVKAYFFIT